MQDLVEMIVREFSEEAVGFIGGIIFFGSWMFQAWESKRAGQPVVSAKFFIMRATASALLTVEGIRSGSTSVTLVMAATLILMLYNLHLALRRSARAGEAENVVD